MSVASPPSTHPDLDLDALIQSLPACKRCRECRRGCDTLLPKCKQCTKAGVECSFYDHGRNELLPRRHIADLIDHVRALHRVDPRAHPAPAASGATPQDLAASAPVPPNGASVKAESVASVASVASETPSAPVAPHEHYFAYAADSYRYLGADACLVKSPRQEAKALDVPFEDDDDWQMSWRQSNAKNFELVEVYLEVIQSLYPVLDLSARYLAAEPPDDLTEPELFNLNMVYSIACHVMPLTNRKRHPEHSYNPSGRLSYHMGNCEKYRGLAAVFFTNAGNYMEAATSNTTMDSLRAILLLTINSLFDPQSGNIGQQLALATRLALTFESQELGPRDAETIRNMHTTIFSLENDIATALDRPATFPEPAWDLCFDKDRPSDYLCSLYRLQHRFRKGDATAKDAAKKLLPLLDQWGHLPASLRLILHQTHLLFNPVWQTGWYVLEAVVSIGSIHIFLTPHWVYRAGTVLIKAKVEIFPGDLIQLYSNALVVLELSSWKWGSAAALSGSLQHLMQQMKASAESHHWKGTLTHYDVRL